MNNVYPSLPGFQPALIAAAKKGKPVLVNVNSFGGRIPLRNMPAYTASKFALAGFTDAIRPEFADLGIHVSQVHPGISLAWILALLDPHLVEGPSCGSLK